jgi:hypothetical protein
MATPCRYTEQISRTFGQGDFSMGWTVILGGNPASLKNLAEQAEVFSVLGGAISMRNPSDILHMHDVPLFDSGELYCLTSPTLDAMDDASAVAARASEWQNKWNGAAALLMTHTSPVIVQQVSHRDNGGRQTCRAMVRVFVQRGVTPESREQMRKLLLSTDPAVNKVLDLCATENSDWVNAYRVYEVIKEASGGIDRIAANGWASKMEIELFKRTANHPEATGTSARHGEQRIDPPAKPMSAAEATALMTRIVNSFLNAKISPI